MTVAYKLVAGKKMKKHKITIIAALTVVVAMLYSCNSSDKIDYSAIYNDFGEITKVFSNGYFEITRDDNVLLKVVEYSGKSDIEVGKRVYFKYSIIAKSGQDYRSRLSYDVKVIVFNNIVAPSIVRESFIAADSPNRFDSIGHDPVRICDVSSSGNYVNLKFEYFRYAESDTRHLVNLVWDDRSSVCDSIYLHLRHNAMGEVVGGGNDMVTEAGIASFKLSDLIPPGKNSIDIKLTFSLDRIDGVGEYVEVERCFTGTFIPYSGTKYDFLKVYSEN